MNELRKVITEQINNTSNLKLLEQTEIGETPLWIVQGNEYTNSMQIINPPQTMPTSEFLDHYITRKNPLIDLGTSIFEKLNMGELDFDDLLVIDLPFRRNFEKFFGDITGYNIAEDSKTVNPFKICSVPNQKLANIIIDNMKDPKNQAYHFSTYQTLKSGTFPNIPYLKPHTITLRYDQAEFK